MAAELTLAELRKAFDVSQEELAEIRDVKQASFLVQLIIINMIFSGR